MKLVLQIALGIVLGAALIVGGFLGWQQFQEREQAAINSRIVDRLVEGGAFESVTCPETSSAMVVITDVFVNMRPEIQVQNIGFVWRACSERNPFLRYVLLKLPNGELRGTYNPREGLDLDAT